MAGQINRAAELWKNWEQKQQMLASVFGRDPLVNDLARQQYDFLVGGMHRITSPSGDEKMVLELIAKATGRLEKQLYPNPVLRFLHQVTERVFVRPMENARMEKLKTENIGLLESSLNRLGFNGADLGLQQKLDYQRQEISVPLAAAYGAATGFQATLKLELDAAGAYQLKEYAANVSESGKESSYTFAAGLDISAKEAFNLLEGRSVFKYEMGRESGHWVRLDFNGDRESGQPVLRSLGQDQVFDLKKELAVLAGELNRGELAANEVLMALESGKQVMVKPVLGGVTFLEAHPAENKVLLRDSRQQVVTLDQIRERQAEQKLEMERSLAPVRQLVLDKKQDKEVTASMQIS